MTTSTTNTSNNSSRSQSQGIFVFEADTAAFASRKRAARACAACQKRKKRCPHTFSKAHDPDHDDDDDGLRHGTRSSKTLDGGDSSDKIVQNLTHKEPIRFVGDFSPENILTDLSAKHGAGKRLARVGAWTEESQLRHELRSNDDEPVLTNPDALDHPITNGHAESVTPNPSRSSNERMGDKPGNIKQAAAARYSKVERGRRTLTGHQRNYLQAVGAFRVLPKTTEDVCVTTYIACIDPLLPIIDGRKFLKQYHAGDASVFLKQAICLIACKTSEAAPFLRLHEDGPVMDPIPFARALHTGLDAAMKADLEADRFTKVQIMTLMSLHNDGPGGIEESSLHLIQAIHDAQTTGVHIKTPGRTRNDQASQLWWTLWTLDKFNACLGGRPLMIADHDIDIQEPEPGTDHRSQALAIWMALGHLLDEVIKYYRPNVDPDATGLEDGFPSWEDLTSKFRVDMLLNSHSSILEICYNIIGILACRSGGPQTTSYQRRVACANRIQSLVSDGKHEALPPIPLLPYAVSLSVTVAYRGLRDHHTEPAESLASLTTRCGILESLGTTWWTADAMARLGRKALKSLQHPPSMTNQDAAKVDIGDAMEAEVSVCKYGPFDERRAEEPSRSQHRPMIDLGERSMGSKRNRQAAQRSHGEGENGDGTKTSSGNALHLLSDAAAKHGLPARGDGTSAGKRAAKSATSAEINTHNDIQAKRRRMDHSSHHSFSGAGPSPRSNSQSGTPTLVSSSADHTPSSYPEVISLNGAPHHTSDLVTHVSIEPTMDPFTNSFVDYSDPAAFHDLDDLFDGFFDLSLPTTFHDSLYDDPSFFSAIPSDVGYNTFMPGSNAMDFGPSGMDMSMNMFGSE